MPADTKPIDLAGLRVLLEKMSPAPWRVELDIFDMEYEGIVAVVEGENERPFFTIATDLTMKQDEWTREKADAQWEQAKTSRPMQDARGIVAIVNAAGALLDRVEALEAGLREALDMHEGKPCCDANGKAFSCDCDPLARLRFLLHPEAPRAGTNQGDR